MSEGGLRVALLARPGEACDRIGDALRTAGAEVVLVANPAASGEDAVREARPQALVVALEPAIEDALDAFEGLLADPAYMVIFEEAELAMQRAGWDAARWTRHLAAKLHRHHDVLPPGAEDDTEWQPSPGPLPPRVEVEDLDQAIAAFADEAQQHADEVPVDTGLDASLSGTSLSLADDAASPFDPVAFEMSELTLADVEVAAADVPELEVATLDVAGIETSGLELEAGDDADGAPTGDEPVTGLSLEPTGVDFDVVVVDEAESSGEQDETKTAEAAPTFDIGRLSLVEDSAEAAVASPPATEPQAPAAGTSNFESSLSGLSLADPDSYGHGPERGAVLVEAGLGGPDAVRQLLAAIPAEFPRPIFVRLQLDGGRYDRLVRQMERVAALPVLLATANGEASPGQIYFLPPELGLRRDKGRLAFDADAAGEVLPDALPPDDSAVLLLSGASRRIADATAHGDWSAALVAGQSPDGSYDPDAALSLIERGGTTATPVELAALLTERWLPSAAPSSDLEDTEA